MIVKFFRHGTGGGSAVFDYLLGKDGDRPDAEILRGDVEQQKLLIDSLDFKRQYTSGCLSFEEAPDHLTLKQKNDIMDGFEETITAGLDADRVSFAWVEHRDKGRLELNFVIANVDLEHGRLFQPYIHSQDKTRVNAWKDLQNIYYDLSDPNDPIRKRLMAQRDNLPRATKEAREAITEGLESMVANGLITNRHEVIKTLQDAGFEIARETDKAISIKNPSGGRNIRLTGGLYERDFKFSPELQETVERDSSAYRDNATGRLREATRVLYEELDRKREYHQARHGEPRREAKPVKDHARTASPSDRGRIGQTPFQRPSPYDRKPRKAKARDSGNDERVFTRVKPNNASSSRKCARLCLPPSMGSGDWLRDCRFSDDGIWRHARNEIRITDHAKTTDTASQQSHASERRHDSAAERDYRPPRAEHREIEAIIDGIGRNARQGTQSVTKYVRCIRDFTEQAHERAASLVESSQAIHRRANNYRRTTEQTRDHTDAAHSSLERVSEYTSTSRRVNERYERIRDDAERYHGAAKEFTERNQAVTEQIDQRVRDCREINKQMTQELEKQRPKRTYSGPSMGR
ncbi:relaxase/mobilization nuclease domain-containing protein [Psychrobacter sp. FME13]|nr:relaxase/mobilization nuclease domain-containing protein [Psychrobacter sp. FME13]MBE0443314.1 relaxase/mobilization nuclease domain-containing protein [Psychrobacter sp. FME13]